MSKLDNPVNKETDRDAFSSTHQEALKGKGRGDLYRQISLNNYVENCNISDDVVFLHTGFTFASRGQLE